MQKYYSVLINKEMKLDKFTVEYNLCDMFPHENIKSSFF